MRIYGFLQAKKKRCLRAIKDGFRGGKMIVEVEKWVFDGSESYKIVKFNACCKKILSYPDIFLNREGGYNILGEYSVTIKREVPIPYEDGTWPEYETISFCPFCGEEIIIKAIREVDKSEFLQTLEEQREVAHKAMDKTDSISERRKFEKERQRLDVEINTIYESDDFPNRNNEE